MNFKKYCAYEARYCRLIEPPSIDLFHFIQPGGLHGEEK